MEGYLKGRRVVVPTFEIQSNPTVKISDVRESLFGRFRTCYSKSKLDIMTHVYKNGVMTRAYRTLCGMEVGKEGEKVTEETMISTAVCSECKDVFKTQEVLNA